LGLFILIVLLIVHLAASAVILSARRLPPTGWRRLCYQGLVIQVGIVLPLLTLLSSIMDLPRWQGACQHGWFDCFGAGTIALLPLLFWAYLSFLSAAVLRPEETQRPWVVLGLAMGGIIYAVYLVHGVLSGGITRVVLHAIHLYVAVWYGWLAVKAMRRAKPGLIWYLLATAFSLPFWLLSISWSKKHFLSLPTVPPDNCFVVTAALRGHETVVGPFTEVERAGKLRRTNRQLLTFWRFEAIWQGHSPRTHRRFRRVYNRLGPCLARRITTRFAADLVYLLLKPFELLAAIAVQRAGRD
jgi:hypothetical protein